VAAVDDLTSSALAAADVVTDELAVARAYNSAAADKGPPGPRLLRAIADSTPAFAHAGARLSGILPDLARDRQRSLLPPIASRVQQAIDRIQPAEQQAALAVAAGKYLPSALGAEGPRTYLVLYSNPAELRPAGGFVGVAGPVTFTAGAPSAIDIHPQEDFKLGPAHHVAVPYPLARYFAYTAKLSLEIGDAGWDPDFPSAAKLSEGIYRPPPRSPSMGRSPSIPTWSAPCWRSLGPSTSQATGASTRRTSSAGWTSSSTSTRAQPSERKRCP
jgi:hypothetical protein